MAYDALIVGARAAGASLALLLARQGRQVLLVDRDRFPSDTMSTHFMNFGAVGALRRLGVLDDMLDAGFRRITRHRTWLDDCSLEVPAGPPGAYSLAPRRDVLDSTLIRHAVEAGVQFAERTRADALVLEAGRVVGATLQAIGGERREVKARVVIGADGKASKVAEWVGAERYHAVPALRPAYYAYLHGIAPQGETAVELWFGGDQIVFSFPMRPDEDCIAIEMQPADFDAFRADPKAAYMERLRALPGLAPRLAHAELEGKVQGVRGIDNQFRKPFGPGWALSGDAAYLKDPATGSGIGDALEQSFMLSKALGTWFDGAPWEETMSAFQSQRDEAFLPAYRMTLDAVAARDQPPEHLNPLRAAALSPFTGRQILAALPGLLDQALDPATVARIEFLARMYEPARQPAPS